MYLQCRYPGAKQVLTAAQKLAYIVSLAPLSRSEQIALRSNLALGLVKRNIGAYSFIQGRCGGARRR